jgi:SAM-dependent methyltransferase
MRSAKAFAAAQGLAEQSLFVVASADALPFADGAFGASCSIAVLEHVPDDERAIAEIARVTRPGGRVYFAVPNSLDRMPMGLRTLYRRHDRWVGHLRHYSGEELTSKCLPFGLRPVQMIYSAHWAKVVQLALDLPLKRLGVPHDRLWWWFEERDARAASRPSGLHLNLILERAATKLSKASS